MAIATQQITNTPAVLKQVAAGERIAVTTMMVCNTATFDPSNPTSGQCNLTVYIIPQNASRTSALHTMVNQITVPAGETVYLFDNERIVLEETDRIEVSSSIPENLTCLLSWMDI